MKLTIDRFEGNYAVCEKESGEMINIPKSELPSRAKEGDVLAEVDGHYVIDQSSTEKKKAEIEELMNDVYE